MPHLGGAVGINPSALGLTVNRFHILHNLNQHRSSTGISEHFKLFWGTGWGGGFCPQEVYHVSKLLVGYG